MSRTHEDDAEGAGNAEPAGAFPEAWLRLREPFDHRARSARVAERLVAQVAEVRRPLRVLELGAGLGSGLRWLAPRMGGAQRWTLVDHDPALLQAAGRALREWAEATGREVGEVTVHPLQADLRDLSALPDDVDVVVCQALLDLASHGWLADLGAWLAARRLPFLAALTVDGRVAWSPSHPLDEAVQAAFRLHQLGDRGFGASPGWHAAQEMADHLRMRGYTVTTEHADWEIGPSAPAMLAEMVRGTAQAARETHPEPTVVDRWEAQRLAAVARGEVGLTVGHVDLVAVP